MSRVRGVVLQNALASYLRQWWPRAESAGNGRHGADILNTPGVAWENKTPVQFDPYAFARQARSFAQDGELPVVVYWPHRIGERNAENTLAIVPLGRLMQLLEEAGHVPARTPVTEPDAGTDGVRLGPRRSAEPPRKRDADE